MSCPRAAVNGRGRGTESYQLPALAQPTRTAVWAVVDAWLFLGASNPTGGTDEQDPQDPHDP